MSGDQDDHTDDRTPHADPREGAPTSPELPDVADDTAGTGAVAPGRSFGGDAEAYERGRPSYPAEAATWLTSDHPCAVLELGAGTGKLTRALLALGHEVDATDPDPAMLAVLEREVPGVETAVSAAEDIPAPDRSYDVVVAGQAAHWFDLERALPEIARVLRPGGRLSLVWNERDERIPWVKRLGALLAGPEQLRDQRRDELKDPTSALEDSGLFGPVDTSSHRFWQVVDRESVRDLVRSRSWMAGLDEAERATRVADVLAFYDDYGRGMDGMQLPYRAQCFRTTVRRQVRLQPRTDGTGAGDRGPDASADSERDVDDTMPRGLRARHRAPAPGHAASGTGRDDDEDDGDQVLLIDFH